MMSKIILKYPCGSSKGSSYLCKSGLSFKFEAIAGDKMHATILKVGYSLPPAMRVKSLSMSRNSKFLIPFDEIEISTLFIFSFSNHIWPSLI